MPFIPQHHLEAPLLHRLLLKFPEFFEGESEVTLATPEGLKRIDRLIVKEKETWIVEYKTHEVIPDDKTAIISQLKTYHRYVSQRYQNVRCFLFWVCLEKIDEIFI
jgi:hypothetical protein